MSRLCKGILHTLWYRLTSPARRSVHDPITRPPVRYNFREFEEHEKSVSREQQEPTKALLQRFFHIRDSNEALFVEGDYFRWKTRKEAAVNIEGLLNKNWNDKKTQSKMWRALGAADRYREWEVGYPKYGRYTGLSLSLEITPVAAVPYFTPTGVGYDHIRNPNNAASPILLTSASLQVPQPTEDQDVNVPTDTAPKQERRWSTALPSHTAEEHRPPYPSTLANREQHQLTEFKTKLVHLGSVRGTLAKAPYAGVGKLSETGMLEGIFAIPVKNNKDLLNEYDDNGEDEDADAEDWEDADAEDWGDIDVGAWEEMPRGIYYLGKDLEDCNNREWLLCEAKDCVNVVGLIKE